MNVHRLQHSLGLLLLLGLGFVSSCGEDGDSSPVDVGGGGTTLGGARLPYEWTPAASPTTQTLWGVWGSSEEVVAVGNAGTAAHRIVEPWETKVSGTQVDLCDVWADEQSSAIAVGLMGTILRYDQSWSSMTNGTSANLADVFGFDDGTALAVGEAGTILHFDGSTWSPITSITSVNLFGVWGTSPSNVYAVGVGGTIVHFDGAEWSFMDTATPENLSAVWGSSASDVWAVGDNGAIMRFDGTSWSLSPSGTTETLGDVSGSSATDIWAVGSAGTIRHYDGTAWSTVASGTDVNLLGVWSRSECEAYAVGAHGVILHYGPGNNGDLQTFLCHNHPNGDMAPPTYGLRIDDLIGEGEYTFSFDYTDGGESAHVTLTYDRAAATIHIQGRAYGGLVAGGAWSPTQQGWIDIDFTYTEAVAEYDNCSRVAGDDLYVTGPSALNTGTFQLDGWGGDASYSFIDRGGGDGCSFVLDNDTDSKGNDAIADDPNVWSGSGWLQPTTSGHRDWLFIAQRLATRVPCDQPE